jgi:hypothetical protein
VKAALQLPVIARAVCAQACDRVESAGRAALHALVDCVATLPVLMPERTAVRPSLWWGVCVCSWFTQHLWRGLSRRHCKLCRAPVCRRRCGSGPVR